MVGAVACHADEGFKAGMFPQTICKQRGLRGGNAYLRKVATQVVTQVQTAIGSARDTGLQ